MASLEPVEILGLVAAFLTAFSSVPQTIRIIKLKKADEISAGTYFMLMGSYVLWLSYGIIKASISIILSNVMALALSGVVLILKFFVWNKK